MIIFKLFNFSIIFIIKQNFNLFELEKMSIIILFNDILMLFSTKGNFILLSAAECNSS